MKPEDDPTLGGTEPLVVSVDLRPGTVFHDRYEILGPLGRGGMGMVYKARDRRLDDEVVAIKILRPDFAQDPTMAARFRSEIKLARRVRHRNVCAIHDYGEDRGLVYISMELIEGVDLKQVLKQHGALPAEQAYEIAIQIAEGLQAVHDAGIVHRDLKTPNIMRDASGIARLMDFGVAKRVGEGAATVTGQIVGTPEYMSPEQAQGHKVDARSDVYALGIVVYEIFTGQVPFRGETPISTILKHLNDPPPLDGPAAARIPPELKAVLRRCLAKDPADRYASAREVGEALREARQPSRRQQPVATQVLRAPTLPGAPAPTAVAARARPRRALQPWLLAVPVAAAAGLALWARGPAATTSPGPTLAAVPPSTLAAAPSTLPSAMSPAAVAARPTPTPRPTRAPATSPSPRAALAVAPPPTAIAAPPTAVAAAPVGHGMLQVVVKPWGEVVVDGRAIGTTPLDRVSLAAGPHVVEVRHPLYEPWQGSVTVRPEQTERLVVDFPAQGRKKQP
jgi:serine/threonine-protein kinase